MVSMEQVMAVLRPWLTDALLLRSAKAVESIVLRMSTYLPDREDFQRLAESLDNALFMMTRDATRGRMLLTLPDDRLVRVRVSDFSVMADDLIYLVFQALPKNQANVQKLRDYSIRPGSLSALRALILDFDGLIPKEEKRTLIRIVRTCHPPFRWKMWLDG